MRQRQRKRKRKREKERVIRTRTRFVEHDLYRLISLELAGEVGLSLTGVSFSVATLSWNDSSLLILAHSKWYLIWCYVVGIRLPKEGRSCHLIIFPFPCFFLSSAPHHGPTLPPSRLHTFHTEDSSSIPELPPDIMPLEVMGLLLCRTELFSTE